MSKTKEPLTQKCPYYQSRGRCAFYGQEKCIWKKGMVEFPYSCPVEIRMEDEAMFGGKDV